MQPVTAYEVAQAESDPFHWHHVLESKAERLTELSTEPLPRDSAIWCSTVAAEFEEFANALVAHFEAEESLRHFKDLLDARPELQQQVDDLIADHRTMILTIEQVRDCLLAANSADKLSRELRRLLEAFAAHERAESAIIRAAYGDDDSTPEA